MSARTPGGGPQALIVVGPSPHPPGTHEPAAGARLVQYGLAHMANVAPIASQVVMEWPGDPAVLAAASTVIFLGDFFPPHKMPDTQRIMADLDAMMRRGCGLVCIHYAVGIHGTFVGPDGNHPLLHWLGGYFANKSCTHHQSLARIFPQATITPTATAHPINQGWHEFTFNDEPYVRNYFGPEGNRPAPNVTILATGMLPPEDPQPEPVAWCVQRGDGGRGYGVVMPHFYKNWLIDDLRRLIFNGIVWSAGVDVPAGGVQVTLPDLATFAPAAVEFVPKPKP